MSMALKVEDFKNFEPHITLKDCNHVEHKFEIRKMIQEMGIFWEAIEFLENDSIGYSFEVYQGLKDDSLDALTRLEEKVKEGLSRKFIKKTIFRGKESLSLSEDIIKGKIEWDDNYNGIPKFKIDGEEYSSEEIGQILMGYEGWGFEFKIKEPTD